MNMQNIFFGSDQSKYASIAIFCAVIAICMTVLFTNNEMTMGQRMFTILVIIIYTTPYILLSLFELTCISSYKNKSGLCWWYGYIITAFIIIISTVVIFSSLMSMLTYSEASKKTEMTENHSKMQQKSADDLAKNMMTEPIKEPKKEEVSNNNLAPDVGMDVPVANSTMSNDIIGYAFDDVGASLDEGFRSL
jgi:hypothetical protein